MFPILVTPFDEKGRIDERAQSVRMLMARRVACILLVGAPRAKPSIARVAKMVATTYIGRLLASVEIDSVSTDDRLGARMATDHLAALGHERIAHVSGGTSPARRDAQHT